MESGVLFISPDPSDARTLARMLDTVDVPLDHEPNLDQARTRLGHQRYRVILTAAQLPDGSWKDVLALSRDLDLPAEIIVTHRLADDRFWAEVLNLGADDLLVQPFDLCEVQRIFSAACRRVARKAAPALAAALSVRAVA